jgi:hypothetical protein
MYQVHCTQPSSQHMVARKACVWRRRGPSIRVRRLRTWCYWIVHIDHEKIIQKDTVMDVADILATIVLFIYRFSKSKDTSWGGSDYILITFGFWFEVFFRPHLKRWFQPTYKMLGRLQTPAHFDKMTICLSGYQYYHLSTVPLRESRFHWLVTIVCFRLNSAIWS